MTELSEHELAKLFFPGVRTENLLQGISLLQSSEGEKRIKLEMAMSYRNGRLVGMPFYIPYEHFAKADSLERFSKLDLEFSAMTLAIYSTEDHDNTAQVLYNVQMGSFALTRDKGEGEELSDISLRFVARAPSNPKLWAWLYAYHRGTMFIKFEPTQSEVGDEKPAEDKQLKLGEEDHEAARKHATSKSQDAQFANA